MSTFYATFLSLERAEAAFFELVDGGSDPDDLSLVVRRSDSETGPMRDEAGSVGDATSFVGRSDDPHPDELVPERIAIENLTTLEASRISPVDTSDRTTDVDSVDQMDDSQEEFELEARPYAGISQGTHEADDVALAALTGFPTLITPLDEPAQSDFHRQDQAEEAIERIEIPGYGMVMGGGQLATAALDLFKNEGACPCIGLVNELIDDGVPEEEARDIHAAFKRGETILAVAVNPGELNEDAVEEIAERHGGRNLGLFDAPRY